jgi:2-C-methyl-D-erythritol 4-phosphate cytidylyltransferase
MPSPEVPFTTAIIVGAGQGTRFGAANKVLAPLTGRPVLAYSLDAAQNATTVAAIIVVASAHLLDDVLKLARSASWPKLIAVIPGGNRRQDSVAAGLASVPSQTVLVAVHDAARPLVSPHHFDDCIAAAHQCGAAIVATPVSDTLKRVNGTTIVETVPREALWAAQTPQCFRVDLLRRAFAHADALGLTVTDEAAMVEALGHPVAIVPGSETNLKITRSTDLDLAAALLALSRALAEGPR